METPKQSPNEFIKELKEATPWVKRTHWPMNLIECKEKDVAVRVGLNTIETSSHYAVYKQIVDLLTQDKDA